jgi:hypothetical protein
MEATGTEPTASAHCVAPPKLSDQIGCVGGRPVVIPQKSIANEVAVLVEGHHAVLLTTDRQCGNPVKESGSLAAS